jgi:hypothetical protein
MTHRDRGRVLAWTLVTWLLAGCGSSGAAVAPASDDAADASVGEVSYDAAGNDAQLETIAPDVAHADVPTPSDAPVDGSFAAYQEACVFHTASEPRCKDCCDCAPVGCTEHTPCRDACKTHDFTKNTDLIDFQVPSTLGPSGDYSSCVTSNTNGPDCKYCCECKLGLACGDYQYCRTLCDHSYGG